MSLLGRRRRRTSPLGRALNLTPLIDINANLLFFLMINASIQEDRLEAGKHVELPESNSRKAEAGDLISIVIALDHISVNEIEVMKLDPGGQLRASDVDKKKDRILPLYQELTARFQDLVQKGAQPGADEDKLPVILVQADRRLEYKTVSKVMRTCGQAGFTRFRFAAREVIPKNVVR